MIERPSPEDICKLLAIKQGQNKNDVAAQVAGDCLRTGKLHAYRIQKRGPKTIIDLTSGNRFTAWGETTKRQPGEAKNWTFK